ncbi:hypothetical protein llap_7094 [Limosa lapponica baueri]|uniref:Uncharacterized protein n=1 Tax=Limosa lapponica baueri TaxID=1758121 RepID=A0A2I0U981_LIMLA|nr:hypothetical protein llap_7094 [Limosa lapponica baueri]
MSEVLNVESVHGAKSNKTIDGHPSNVTTFVSKDCDADAPEGLYWIEFDLQKCSMRYRMQYEVFLIGLIVSCCKGKKSVIEGEVDEDDSDMSDDELPVYYR